MLASLFSSGGSSTIENADRRRASRQRIDREGELRAVAGGSRASVMAVEVRDISTTGLGIVHDRPLAVGQKFVVKQDLLPPDAPRLYTVVRSDTTPDGRYSIGLHASKLLDPHAEVHPRHGGWKGRAALTVVASIVVILAIAALMMY